MFTLTKGVTIEDREVVHKGKIVTSCCLIAGVVITDDDASCGYSGELRVVVGDIHVARKLQHVLDAKLA